MKSLLTVIIASLVLIVPAYSYTSANHDTKLISTEVLAKACRGEQSKNVKSLQGPMKNTETMLAAQRRYN